MSDAVARLNAALEGLMALLLASILLLLPGCGGDDSTGPSGPTVASIAVEGPPGAVTSVGEAGPFFATASLSDGTSQDVTAEAKWTSSDPSVVTISATGAGRAVGAGQSEVCARYQGVSGCMLVTVTAPVAMTSVNVVDFAFNPPDILVTAGPSVTWTWTGSVQHNVTFSSLAITSATQAAGNFQAAMPTATGVYTYQCTIHPTLMNGSVTVQ